MNKDDRLVFSVEHSSHLIEKYAAKALNNAQLQRDPRREFVGQSMQEVARGLKACLSCLTVDPIWARPIARSWMELSLRLLRAAQRGREGISSLDQYWKKYLFGDAQRFDASFGTQFEDGLRCALRQPNLQATATSGSTPGTDGGPHHDSLKYINKVIKDIELFDEEHGLFSIAHDGKLLTILHSINHHLSHGNAYAFAYWRGASADHSIIGNAAILSCTACCRAAVAPDIEQQRHVHARVFDEIVRFIPIDESVAS